MRLLLSLVAFAVCLVHNINCQRGYQIEKGDPLISCGVRIFCDSRRPYRSYDGSCNNLKKPLLGKSNTPYNRFIKETNYGRGGSVRTRGVGNSLLPNPRTIALKVHLEGSKSRVNNQTFGILGVLFGQIIAHDVTRTPFVAPSPQCDRFPFSHPECLYMRNENNPDPRRPFFSAIRTRFTTIDSECKRTIREQINGVSHWLDLSVNYGNDDRTAASVRGQNGQLQSTTFRTPRGQETFPLTSGANACGGQVPGGFCYRSGEERLSENTALTSVQNVWLREHNRIAREIRARKNFWSSDKIFEETRRIVIAEYQAIIYNEWLPLILGDAFTSDLNSSATYAYNHTVNAQLYNEFAAAALRFGHTLVNERYLKKDYDYSPIKTVQLREIFNSGIEGTRSGGLDALLVGLLGVQSAPADTKFIDTLLTDLFVNTIGPGHSLAALNIARGRDHGLMPYNEYREACNLGKANDWSDLTNIPASVINDLDDVYDNVGDIDLFTGGLSEQPVNGGVVGATFACILGKQFSNFKYGDRFHYESKQSGFTDDQIKQLNSLRFSKVICDNVKIDRVFPKAFEADTATNNAFVQCDQLTGIDIEDFIKSR